MKRKTVLKRKTPLKRGPWRRITRQRRLTPDEAAKYQSIRDQVAKEFPKRQPNLLQRKTWLKRESERHKIDREIYSLRRKMFLKEHPWCELKVTCGAFHIKRDIPGVTQIEPLRRATQVHHRRGRGKWYLVEEHWLATCRECHAWENDHRNEAVKLGLRERIR